MEAPLQTLRVEADARPTAAGGETAQTIGRPPGAAGVSALPPVASTTELALLDLVRGARAHHLWGLLGWQDIRRRYRRSILGPFWITISLGVFVAALGTLYGALLKVELAEYVPYLALGFIVWTLISNMLTDGCTVFTAAEGIIKQVNQPLSVHLYRIVWRNFIIFSHNAVIFVVVAVLFSVWPGVTGLLALVGLVLLCLNGAWAGLLLGIVSWLAVAGITLGGWLVTFVMFRRYRWRIAYWI